MLIPRSGSAACSLNGKLYIIGGWHASTENTNKVECYDPVKVKFHDQGDADWIVIRGQLRGHNDTPCGRPTYWPLSGRIRSFLITNY
jgi:hypothetical protein